MNAIIELLNSKNELTIANVKKVYRKLSKKVHPDLSEHDYWVFIKLHEEYIEALKIVESKNEEILSKPRNKQENNISVVLFSFEMIGTKNYKRYYEMAVYLLSEYYPGVDESFKRLYSLIKKGKADNIDKLKTALIGECAAVSDSRYGNKQMCNRLFDSYVDNIKIIQKQYNNDIKIAIDDFEKWLKERMEE